MEDLNFLKVDNSFYLKKVTRKKDITEEEFDGYLIDSDEKEARRIIDSLKGKNKIIAVLGRDNLFNRRAIEKLKIDYLVSPERGLKKDSLKQKDSGINHVLAKEACKKNISIVIDMGDLYNLEDFEKIKRIGRMIQNIKICRKYKCNIKIASLSKLKEGIFDKISRIAIGKSLGMSSSQLRGCVSF